MVLISELNSLVVNDDASDKIPRSVLHKALIDALDLLRQNLETLRMGMTDSGITERLFNPSDTDLTSNTWRLIYFVIDAAAVFDLLDIWTQEFTPPSSLFSVHTWSRFQVEGVAYQFMAYDSVSEMFLGMNQSWEYVNVPYQDVSAIMFLDANLPLMQAYEPFEVGQVIRVRGATRHSDLWFQLYIIEEISRDGELARCKPEEEDGVFWVSLYWFTEIQDEGI
jgi:hypothetical protein